VVPRFKDKVHDYKNLPPVIRALLDKAMKRRQWVGPTMYCSPVKGSHL